MTNPYQAIGPIRDVNNFVGRSAEIKQMVYKLMVGSHPTSINLVAQNQYGKTSLLKNFAMLAKKYINQDIPSRVQIIYLNLQEPNLNSPSSLVWAISEQIASSINEQAVNPSLPLFSQYNELEKLIRICGHRVIVLIDEVEVALMNPTEFTESFWGNLRAIISESTNLSFVLTTQLPLQYYWGLLEHLKNNMSSPLYNMLIRIELHDFNDQEIEELFDLSDIRFNWEERNWILKFAGGNPQKLQVASFTMYDLKNGRQNLITEMDFKKALAIASATYQVNSNKNKSEKIQKTMLILIVIGLLAFIAPLIGSISRITGDLLDSLVNTIVGVILVLLLILVLLGKFPLEKIREYIERIIGYK